jgi:hypothetical protein
MKKLISISIGLALCASAAVAQTNTFGNQVSAFFRQNPTTLWEVGGYGMADVTSQTLSKDLGGYGGGGRVSYWITPSVGAALDVNYSGNGGLSYGVFSLAGRGTLHLGKVADVTLYGIGGPGYQLKGGNKSLIAMIGSGGDVKPSFFKWGKFFGEYQHRTTSPETRLVLFGIKKEF